MPSAPLTELAAVLRRWLKAARMSRKKPASSAVSTAGLWRTSSWITALVTLGGG